MASLNKVIIIGNLGKNPETRMAGQTKVSSFSVAVTEKYKDKSGVTQDKTEWINVSMWGRLAEICEQYLQKGSSVYIEGKLVTQSWDDKTTGEKKYRTEVVGSVLQMLGGKQEQSGSKQNSADTSGFSAPPAPEDDFEQLPF